MQKKFHQIKWDLVKNQIVWTPMRWNNKTKYFGDSMKNAMKLRKIDIERFKEKNNI